MTARILSAMIFAALALILSGFALAVWFEAAAIFTGKESTISQLAAGAIRDHRHLALFSAFVLGCAIGALATHFTRWNSLG